MHHKPPLRERVVAALHRLRIQQNRLEGASIRMQQHDKELFSKCVSAQMSKDSARAAMYASECSEIRKIARVTLRCQLALEQVSIRLETVEQFGDIAAMMGPVASVVRDLKQQISGVMPEVSFELGEIGESLNSIVLEVGEASGHMYNVETSDQEAQKILGEANVVAEQKMKEKFPELPEPASPSSERTQNMGLPK